MQELNIERAAPLPSLFWTAILSIVIFLVFTPFESPDSFISVIIPRIALIVGICLVAPLIVFRPYRSFRPALFMMVGMAIHLTLLDRTDYLQLIAEWVGFVSIVLFARAMVDKRWEAGAALTVVLLVNLAALAVQFISHQLNIDYFDFHKLIYPMSEARAGAETYAQGVRISGFHLEPGTYSSWVAMLVVLSRLLKGKFGIIEWISTGSLLLTYSTAGIIYVAVIGYWIAIDLLRMTNVKSIALLTMLVFGAGIAFTTLGLDEYLLERFGINLSRLEISGGKDQQEWRQDAINVYMDLPSEEKLNGFGHTADICGGCPFDDLGFLPNMAMRGGIIGVFGILLTVVAFIKLLGLNLALLLLAIVGSIKAPTNALAPWIVLFVASEVGLSSVRERRKNAAREKRRRRKMREENLESPV